MGREPKYCPKITDHPVCALSAPELHDQDSGWCFFIKITKQNFLEKK